MLVCDIPMKLMAHSDIDDEVPDACELKKRKTLVLGDVHPHGNGLDALEADSGTIGSTALLESLGRGVKYA